MKTRMGFVSNSSSSSFIINKKDLTAKQLLLIKEHHEITDCPWKLEENRNYISGKTGMNNFRMPSYLESIGVKKYGDYDTECSLKTLIKKYNS